MNVNTGMNLDRDAMMEQVRAQMPSKRWQHTLGVMESAAELVNRFGGSKEKAELAALLHDYCKYWPVERQVQTVLDKGLPQELLDYDRQLLHGPVAAAVLEEETGIHDAEVLDAVRWHTSGRVGMTQLDKIVCLADYIEPGRDFPGVHNIRHLAESSLEEALVAGFDSTIRFLLEKKSKVYPLTMLARNALLDEIKQSGKPERGTEG